jgi:hypothetical protein
LRSNRLERSRHRQFWLRCSARAATVGWRFERYGPVQRRGNRTVCVRRRDGYFWPVSFATARASLEQDRCKCEESCESPARLYAAKDSETPLEHMKDESGRCYRDLKTAFVYRALPIRRAANVGRIPGRRRRWPGTRATCKAPGRCASATPPDLRRVRQQCPRRATARPMSAFRHR